MTDPSNRRTQYGYDAVSDVTSMADPMGRTTSYQYKYNGDGLRMSKTTGNSTTTYAWDTADGTPLLLQDGSLKYITGPSGLPLEQVNGNKALYYYQDVLGSTRAIVNSNGSTQATYVYGAYGNLKSSTGTVSNPFQFAGQYVDSESGLQYLRARYYDPTTNQFLTVDPVVAETQEPYSYAADDPVNLVDPTGLHTVGICLTGGAGVGSGFFLQGCIQIELGRGWDDRVGVTGTVGGGAGTPSVSINVSPVTTTATSISDLNGPFVYLGGSGGEGPSVGYDAFIGRTARCGSYVFGGGPTFGLDGNPPFPPVEVHGGVSDTWSWVPGGDPPDDPSPCSCQGK